MKKFALMLLTTLLSFTSASAIETVDWNVATAGLADMQYPKTITLASGYTATFGGPSTNYSPVYSTYYGGIQFYAGSTLTIQGQGIKQILLYFVQGYPGSLTVDSGDLNTNDTFYAWGGDASSVVFTNSVQGFRLTGIRVKYDAGGGSEEPGDEPGTDEPTYSDDVSAPAAPTVVNFTNSLSAGASVTVTIPTEDVNGTALDPAKVYYQILKDIEKTVTPVTIAEVGDAELEQPISEDLVTIAYGYEDYYVENAGGNNRKVWLENATDLNSYNKIGVQTIYRGSVEQTSEVAWYTIKDYASDEPIDEPGDEPGDEVETVTATWVPAEKGYANAQDLGTEPVTTGYTITFALGDNANNAAPKYYTAGSAARVYAYNTFTIAGPNIVGVVVKYASGNAGNLTASVGTVTQNTEELTWIWTGKANSIVFKNDNNGQMRITGIDITYEPSDEPIDEPGDDPVQEDVLVVVPATATVEADWMLRGTYYDTDDTYSENYPVQVAFDGNDVYIQGLAYWFEDAWVKGTLSGTTLTIPTGQYVGEDEYGSTYFIGLTATTDEATNAPVDIEFTYDASAKTFTQVTPYMGEASQKSGDINDILFYVWSGLTLYQGEAPASGELVELPEGVTPEDWTISAYDPYYGENKIRPAQVAIVGNTIYLNGLSESMPDAWIVGTIDGNQATFAGNQYMGTMDLSYFGYGELAMYFNPSGNVVFTYDADAGMLTAAGYSTELEGLGSFDELEDIVITKVVEKPATPATPTILGYSDGTGDEYPYIQFAAPFTDVEGNYLAASKLYYEIVVKDAQGNVNPLSLSKDLYGYFTETLTEIPYLFSDGYDIEVLNEERVVYLNQDLTVIASWANIGVKTIYKGGGETHESEIAWALEEEEPGVDPGEDPGEDPTDGINGIDADDANARYFDLQGRPVDKSAKGIVIKQVRDRNGKLTTVKVVR